MHLGDASEAAEEVARAASSVGSSRRRRRSSTALRSRRASRRGGVGRGGASAGVGLDAGVNDSVDLADALLRDALADGGYLGHDGSAQAASSGLLGGQVLTHHHGHTEAVEDRLLGDQGGDGLVG